jgi:hypothetical protein
LERQPFRRLTSIISAGLRADATNPPSAQDASISWHRSEFATSQIDVRKSGL